VDKVAHKSLAYRFSEDSSEDAVIIGDDSGIVALLLIYTTRRALTDLISI
jgi:hypothetical protein